MNNGFLASQYRRFVCESRVLGLAVGDLRDIAKDANLPHSSRTIFSIVKDLGIRVKRRTIGTGRSDLKVKLGRKARILSQWIQWAFRFDITFEDPDMASTVTEYIDSEEEPP